MQGHLLLVDMIVQGYRYPTVVALSRVQSLDEESAIKLSYRLPPYYITYLSCHNSIWN